MAFLDLRSFDICQFLALKICLSISLFLVSGPSGLRPLDAVYQFIALPLFSMGKAIVAGELKFLSHAWGALLQLKASLSIAVWQALLFRCQG